MQGAKTGGRNKGVSNKSSAEVRQMIHADLEAAGGPLRGSHCTQRKSRREVVPPPRTAIPSNKTG